MTLPSYFGRPEKSLVERLRTATRSSLRLEAAERIEELEARNEQLRFHHGEDIGKFRRETFHFQERINDLQEENARLRDVIKFKDDLIEKLGQQVKDLREENARIEDDSIHAHAGFIPIPLRRRAEEAVDYLSEKMGGRQPSGYKTMTITTLDAKLLFDLIRELAGLEGKKDD